MSLETLTQRDEITVFEHEHVQDDMGGWTEVTATRRRKLRCRMHPMSRDERIEHDVPMLVEAYTALFAFDPEMTLHSKAIFNRQVYDLTNAKNRSGQNWLWEVGLVHNPGLEIDAGQ
jgi:hypothetical protein